MSPDYFSAASAYQSRSSPQGSPYSSYPQESRRGATSPRNVYTHCGRHTDQYLFGGRGFSDMWRAITKKD
jgi:hypothetical protein